MCVTVGEAEISETRTYVHATRDTDGTPRHICGYQNKAMSLSGPNCMFLNFHGTDLALVQGPEHTRTFMGDMTASLPELAYQPRGAGMYGTAKGGMAVSEYGDYTVILSQGPGDILSLLGEVREDRRPARTQRLQDKIVFYMAFYPNNSFVLACFNGVAVPKHPITVSYRPLDPTMLVIPGLDGHDGRVPIIGAPVFRNFRVAFGVEDVTLPITPRYQERVDGKVWAPSTVTGFVDNRFNGPNGDYIMPMKAVKMGLVGQDLAGYLVGV